MKKIYWILLLLAAGYACSDDDKDLPAVGGVTFSDFVDGRDGRTYRCITVNGQTWMAENLSYRLPGGSWDGCYSYMEEQMDSTDLFSDAQRFKEVVNEDLKNGVVAEPPGSNFSMMLNFYLGTFFEVPQFIQMFAYFPELYAYLQEVDGRLKLEAKDQVAGRFLEEAEKVNGGYMGRYGFLYSFEGAAMAVPEGWRLPTDEDWKELERSLGMSEGAVGDMEAWRGSGQGILLMEGEDGMGFAARMGGGRLYGAVAFGSVYRNCEAAAYFWSSTQGAMNDSTKVAVIRKLGYNNGQVFRGTSPLYKTAYSVRCIKK